MKMKYFLFLIISVFLLWSSIPAYADNSPTVLSSFINNEAYGMSDSYPDGTINSLIAGSTKLIYLTGLVEDLDGYADIDNVRAVFYRSSKGYNCSPDNNDCYVINSCETQTAADPNQRKYNCGIALKYFIDATDSASAYPSDNWQVFIEVYDGLTTGALNTTNKEIGSLLALSIPENIDFGTMAMGASTTTVNDQETVFTQKGNTAASVEVNSPAENFTCSIRGTIPRQNQRWSLSTFDWAAGTAIGGTPVDANINIALQTDDYTIPTDSLFWGIKIPESGLEGICTNVVVIAAIAQ